MQRLSGAILCLGALFINDLLWGQAAGLVASYSFDEGAGTTVADSSGYGNAGTLNGATWTTQGKFGNALNFNGVNSLVAINAAPSLNTSTAMTLEAWVYPAASQSGWRTIVQREVDAYFLHASSSYGPLRPAGGGTFGGSVRNLAGPTAIAVGAWTHLALTYDGAALRLYVNGSQAASQAISGSIETNSKPLRIGGNSPYGEYFNGLIDEVRVYNRALSQTEIQNDMVTPIGGTPPSSGDGGPCDLTLDGTVDQSDVEMAVSKSLASEPCNTGICVDGVYSVVAVQRVVIAATGGTCLDSGGSMPHAVDLAWTASISTNVVGYNAYRGTTSSGPYTKLNSSLISGTTFTDTTAESGKTYYYVTTAVDSNSQESVYSNEAVAYVPSS